MHLVRISKKPVSNSLQIHLYLYFQHKVGGTRANQGKDVLSEIGDYDLLHTDAVDAEKLK